MFTAARRDTIRAELVAKAAADPRIVAAAAVGSSAGGGDALSDLDLTFGVTLAVPVTEVLAAWTEDVTTAYDAVVLFDVAVGQIIYRVFLLPGGLQVDLSFAPAAEFGARGPRFQLLFGEAIQHPPGSPPPLAERVGYAVHHLLRAHICIARSRFWQAQHWIAEARTEAMTLACHRLGLPDSQARGFDLLPAAERDCYAATLIGTLTAEALRPALLGVADLLLAEGSALPQIGRIRANLAPVLGSVGDAA